MKVRDIMTKNVVTLNPQQTAVDAAKVMQAHNIGAVPVCSQNDEVVGIVTDRDIVVRNVASQGDPAELKVQDFMTKNVISATPEMDVNQVSSLMSVNKVRRLPVIENKKLVGVVALGDLAVDRCTDEKAGEALSDISTPSRPENLQ